MSKNKLYISHFIPCCTIGGVEVGIYKSYAQLNKVFDYNVFYVLNSGSLSISAHSFTTYIKKLFSKSQHNGITITSLWPCHCIGLFSLLFNQKWVMFLHSEKYHSLIDKLVTSCLLQFCDNFLCDSKSALALLPSNKKHNCFIVPYVFLDNHKSFNNRKEFDISWVGRNSPVKRLDLLVIVIRKLLKINSNLKILLIISGNESSDIKKLLVEYSNNLRIFYNIEPSDVNNLLYKSKVTLCLSDYEGFSMSTVESILNYNLIAARKVGDLPLYLSDEFTIWLNKLTAKSIDSFCSSILDILSDKKKLVNYQMKCNNAFKEKFKNKDYISSLSTALKNFNQQSII